MTFSKIQNNVLNFQKNQYKSFYRNKDRVNVPVTNVMCNIFCTTNNMLFSQNNIFFVTHNLQKTLNTVFFIKKCEFLGFLEKMLKKRIWIEIVRHEIK